MVDETPIHLSDNCTKTELLWDQLKEFISNTTLSILSLRPWSAILGHIDLSDDYLLINHLFLIHKFYISNYRNCGYLNIKQLKAIIDKTKSIEEEISQHEPKKYPSILRNSVLSMRTLYNVQKVQWTVRGRRASSLQLFFLSLSFYLFCL